MPQWVLQGCWQGTLTWLQFNTSKKNKITKIKRVWYIQGKGVNFHSICWQEKAKQEKDVPIDWYIYEAKCILFPKCPQIFRNKIVVL